VNSTLCDSFRKNPDGSWTCIKPAAIMKPDGGVVELSPGITFRKGVAFMGVDVAGLLDENCA